MDLSDWICDAGVFPFSTNFPRYGAENWAMEGNLQSGQVDYYYIVTKIRGYMIKIFYILRSDINKKY